MNRDDKKIFELVKKYNKTGFPDDEMSLGYAINVYQETINKMFQEYLVNFKYLQRIMEDYGFILMTQDEATLCGLPNGTGSFKELYESLIDEMKRNTKKRNDYKTVASMQEDEKQISFLNMFFVFKKVRNIPPQDFKKLYEYNDVFESEITEEKQTEEPIKLVSKKLKRPKIMIEATVITMPDIKITEEPKPEEPKPEEPKPEEPKEEVIIIKKIRKSKKIIT